VLAKQNLMMSVRLLPENWVVVSWIVDARQLGIYFPPARWYLSKPFT